VVLRARQDIDFATFPTGDGEPMAETETHRRQMSNLIFNFSSHTEAHPRVYVGGNMLMYYTRGYGLDHVSPDVFVTFDVPRGIRQKWETWNENGRFADLVVEITSPSTYLDDLGKKRRLYSAPWCAGALPLRSGAAGAAILP
jgi:Uma2 family endonuclease